MSKKNWNNETIINRLIFNKTTKTYWNNISELRSRASKELFEKCVELTKSQNDKERMIGIDLLAQLSDKNRIRPFSKKVIGIYINLLKKENNPINLMSILYGIGHNSENITKNTHIELICTFKNHQEDCVREGVTFALNGIDNENAIETLIFLSEDRRTYIRNWATFGIGTQLEIDNSDIRKCLWKRVYDKHQDTKLEAIYGLAKRKDKDIKTIIVKELQNYEFGTLLFDAIEELNDKTLLPILELHLQKSEKDKTINSEWINDLNECINKLKTK